MKKLVLGVLFCMVLSSTAYAGSWNIHCTNNSCVADQGRIKVYWVSNSFENMYTGKLTGVDGLPISVGDFKSVEQNVNKIFESNIPKQKEAKQESDNPLKVNMNTDKSVSRSKISIDYTLAFVQWLGDTRYNWDRSIKRYWSATELILDSYSKGSILPLIEGFFFSKNASEIGKIQIDITINDKNKMLVFTKYIGLTNFAGVPDEEARYSSAYDKLSNLVNSKNPADQKELDIIYSNYKKNMESLKVLIKPNQTALKLWQKDKELAYAKWFGDNYVAEHINDHKDRYLVAIILPDKLKQIAEKTEDMKQLGVQFETAIKNKDQSVTMVTIKGIEIPWVLIVAVLGLIMIAGATIFFKKLKSKRVG